MLDGSTYRQPTGLAVDVEGDGWARVRRAGTDEAILLDPHVYRIWSAADSSTPVDVASHSGVSTYLAACIVALLERVGLFTQVADPAGARTSFNAHIHACFPGTTIPAAPAPAAPLSEGRSIPAIVLHHHARADLDTCLHALSQQGKGVIGEIRVLASIPVAEDVPRAVAVECDPDGLRTALAEELDKVRADAVLLLDSQIVLASDAVARMAHALDLRADLAAIAPRVMWQAWPAIVVSVGDWRMAPDEVHPSPHTGHVDVGQFARRWQETPGVHFQAALMRSAVLRRVGLPDRVRSLDRLGAAWSAQARADGYRTIAALQALAYGPWPTNGRVRDKAQDPERPAGGPHTPIEKGLPALTVESVRAIYCHQAGITPRGVRPRVSIVARGGSHVTAIVDALATTCEVRRFDPEEGDGTLLREQLRDANVVVVSQEALAQLDYLQEWPAPILLDAPPADSDNETANTLLRMVDGAVCMHGPAPGGTPGRDRNERILDGEAWVMTRDGSRAAAGSGARPEGMSLADFCRQPVMAPEREIQICLGSNVVQPPPPPPTPLRALPARAWQMLRQRGPGGTVREVGRYVRWKVGL